MKPIANALALSLMLAAGLAFAKVGVKDPGVKLRMDTMDTIAMNMKLLANMAGGKMDFSTGDAGAAKTAVMDATKKIPEIFKGHDMDPASDARPVIWSQWDDFTQKANATHLAVELIDTDTLDQLQSSLGQVAKACKDCHTTYRN